jgi:hypothetical protein
MGAIVQNLVMILAGVYLLVTTDGPVGPVSEREMLAAGFILILVGCLGESIQSAGRTIRDGLVEAAKEARRPLKPWEK